ncbi:hypothetical protein [Streptomyces sp. SBT349]|uniref:hypothetical protein n=1 Tax=Streptomyces sp. SBT349 TaxID=1580539 RepID=UPI00066E4B2C|nr:hypothetical protein [Streptomyces sp. SBT349]
MALLANPMTYLNTDGRPHPRENTIAAVTLALGLVAFFASFFNSAHVVSSWFGLAGVLTGACSQMISATTGQRFVTVIGAGAAATGGYLGMAHGGLFGGWLG